MTTIHFGQRKQAASTGRRLCLLWLVVGTELLADAECFGQIPFAVPHSFAHWRLVSQGSFS